MEIDNPKLPSQKLQVHVEVPEEERRQAHISLVPQDYPLLPIALNCLKKKEEQPSAEELCDSLEQLKSSPSYASSVEQTQDSDRQLQELRQTIQDKDREIQDKDREIAGLQQGVTQRDRQIQALQQTIASSEELIGEFRKQTLRQQEDLKDIQQESQKLRLLLEQKNQQIAQLQQGMAKGQILRRQTQGLQTQLQQLELSQGQQKHQPQVRKKSVSKEITLSCRKGPKAPSAMTRGSSTIIGNIAYFYSYHSRSVHTFHCNTTQWSTLPNCPYKHSTLTNINNQLTIVGGDYPATNKLLTLHDVEKKWMELYPPMNNERRLATVLSTNTHIVAMGGVRGVGDYITSTEVLQLSTNQWSTTSPLPYGIYWATTTLCDNNIYFIGGFTKDSNKDYSVICCNVTELLQTTQSSKVWHNIPDLQVRFSTCVTVQGQLLAIGGKDKQKRSSNSIYKYDRDTNQWSDKGHMIMARQTCLATLLPNNNLLVVGGWDDSGMTDETEIATIA